MPEAERLNYTVTPGSEVLAKMGTSWTLFASPPVMFTVGPAGEPPEPATVTMTAEQAADLASSGYVVEEALSVPEPVNDVQVSPGPEGVEPEPVDDVRMPALSGDLAKDGKCLLCGKDWPHMHTEQEVAEWEAKGGARGDGDQSALVTYAAGDGEERTEAVEGMPLPGGFAVRDSVDIGAAENRGAEEQVYAAGVAQPVGVRRRFVGTAENMPGEPAEGIQVEPGTQADGSPTEPVKRRKT